MLTFLCVQVAPAADLSPQSWNAADRKRWKIYK